VICASFHGPPVSLVATALDISIEETLVIFSAELAELFEVTLEEAGDFNGEAGEDGEMQHMIQPKERFRALVAWLCDSSVQRIEEEFWIDVVCSIASYKYFCLHICL
jgi:hypothetical protein